ncbi:hypothetical protein PPYR_14286 [Photinus pyralis]|uniref:C2H2-type domain-containing protein n=1 Tax=Photinus pyralis TaxID=7054 RepID=A0A1Y1NC69_PHOPY|nr:hypothetical protein PPYR_14286 [Photinus pyralis]
MLVIKVELDKEDEVLELNGTKIEQVEEVFQANDGPLTSEFKCGECDYVSHLRKCLVSHCISDHNWSRRLAVQLSHPLYKCDKCVYLSNTKDNLTAHSEHHLSAFKCSLCPFVTHGPGYLKRHLARRHKVTSASL